MGLTNKAYERIHNKTGSDKAKLKTVHDQGFLDININDPEGANPFITSLIHQIGLMQDELDYLRTEIESNKDNKTVIGSNTTLSFGDLTATTVKGVTTYTINMTATRDFGGKVGSQTKSIRLTLS